MEKEKDNPKIELGRRVLAALLSYQLGNKSIDHTKKAYCSGDIDPVWAEIGWDLLCAMNGVKK